MDLATLIGLTIAIVGILGGFMFEGGSMAGLINIPGLRSRSDTRSPPTSTRRSQRCSPSSTACATRRREPWRELGEGDGSTAADGRPERGF